MEAAEDDNIVGESAINIEECISELGAKTPEEIEDIKGHVRGGKYTINNLRLMCRHLSLPSTKPKAQLIDSIVSRTKHRVILSALEGTFRKDNNTIPRLLNFLFQYPEAVIASFNVASRADLQNDNASTRIPVCVIIMPFLE